MASGYSLKFAQSVQDKHAAEPGNPLFSLVKMCIEHDIPIATVADELNVSRVAFYAWVDGEYKPSDHNLKLLSKMETRYKKRYGT